MKTTLGHRFPRTVSIPRDPGARKIVTRMSTELYSPSVLSCVKWRGIALNFFLSARRGHRRIFFICNDGRNAAERKKDKQDTSVDA